MQQGVSRSLNKKEKPRDANVEAGSADGDKVQQGVN